MILKPAAPSLRSGILSQVVLQVPGGNARADR